MAKTKIAAPKTKYQTCEIQRVNRSKLKFMPGNAQAMTEAEKTRLKKSIEDGDVGLVDTPTWNKRTGHIVGGHHRIMCIDEIEGHQTYDLDVAVIDVDEPTERAINLMLNNPRNRGTYDPQKLAEFLAGIPDSHAHQTGFSDADREWLLGNQIERKDKTPRIDDAIWGSLAEVKAPDVEEAEEDETPDVEDVVYTERGDVWTLGKHRLICGDSTVKADVAAVLDGEIPFMMVTDPPYGVTYDPKWRADVPGGFSTGVNRSTGKVTNDDRASWKEAWDLFPGVVAYVWHGALHSTTVAVDMLASKFDLRAQIIWVKPSLVIGRGAYHWRHEPCAKPGSLVKLGGPRGNDEWVPIEEIQDGDTVASWRQGFKVSMRGRKVRTAKRRYRGKMHTIMAGGCETSVTHNHHWTVRRSDGGFVTYLMCDEGFMGQRRWRVGMCQVSRKGYGFGPAKRLVKEDGDAIWLLSYHETKEEAIAHEQGISVRFGIPTTAWIVEGKDGQRTGRLVDEIYRLVGPLEEKATALLKHYGRDPEYPLLTIDDAKTDGKRSVFSRKYGSVVRSCNLMPGVFELPKATFSPRKGDPNGAGREGYEWVSIEGVTTEDYDGFVYSLDVPEDHHYIQDGLITHNCWYGSRGTAKWTGDRKQSTAWEIANMHRTQGNVDDGKTIHGTQKPVECMARPIRNHGDESDHVYDPFLGSGTTLIACEQLGRRCFGVEIAPEYCDLIVRRWQNLTGEEAIRDDGETLATLEAAGAGRVLEVATPDDAESEAAEDPDA